MSALDYIDGDTDEEVEGDPGEPPAADVLSVDIHWSSLREIARSPKHYKHAALRPWGGGSLCQRMGTAAHAATFEPHRLVTYGPGEWTDEKGKVKSHKGARNGAAWEQFKAAQASDAVIVNARERKIAEAIAHALRSDPIAAPLLFGPGVVREQEILWAIDGRRCSSRPDARKPAVHITELKVVRTGEPERFIWTATKALYHGQCRFYDRADAYETGRHLDDPPIDLYIVAVESFEPYVVTTYQLDDTAKYAADRLTHKLWTKLRAHEAINFWPGYTQSIWQFEVDIDRGAEELTPGELPEPDFGEDNEPIEWNAAP